MVSIKQEIEKYERDNIICRINDTIDFYVSHTNCECDIDCINSSCVNCVYESILSSEVDCDYFAITKHLYDILKSKKSEYIFIVLDFYVWATTSENMFLIFEEIVYDKISSEACESDVYVPL